MKQTSHNVISKLWPISNTWLKRQTLVHQTQVLFQNKLNVHFWDPIQHGLRQTSRLLQVMLGLCLSGYNNPETICIHRAQLYTYQHLYLATTQVLGMDNLVLLYSSNAPPLFYVSLISRYRYIFVSLMVSLWLPLLFEKHHVSFRKKNVWNCNSI